MLLRSNGPGAGIEVHDLATRKPLRSFVLPPEDAARFWASGLSCDASGTLPF